jgi:hypothetical protein
MQVKDYYSLSDQELAAAIDRIRWWFIDHTHHPEYRKVMLALEVALCARDLKRDEFIELLLATLVRPCYS